jgi:hypothetical protein
VEAGMNTLTEGGHEMLRAAVNAARHFQCRSVTALKERLVLGFPGREAEINEAIQFWADSVRARYPDGLPAK